MVSWIFANIYGSIFKYYIYMLWGETGCTGLKRVFIMRGNKSLERLETPSSDGIGSRPAAKRRGFLCSKNAECPFLYKIR